MAKRSNPDKPETRAVTAPKGMDVTKLPPELQQYYNLKLEDSTSYHDNVEQRDFVIPRASLVQKMSPITDDDNYKEGMIVKSNEPEIVFLRDPKQDVMVFVPCYDFKSRMMFPKDFQRGQAPVCRADDYQHGVGDPGGLCAKCPMKDWRDKEKLPPRCNEFVNFYGLAMDENQSWHDVVLSCKSTDIKFARDLRTEILRRAKQAPFTQVYQVGVMPKKSDKGSWYNFELRRWSETNLKARPVSKIELLRRAATLAESAKGFRAAGRLSIDADQIREETEEEFAYGANAPAEQNASESTEGATVDDGECW